MTYIGRNPERILEIIIEAMNAIHDPDLVVETFRMLADKMEDSGDDDGTLAQLFEDVALAIEGIRTPQPRE